MVKLINDKLQAPFIPVSNGYGYQGNLLYDDVEEKIQCHECGEWFTQLTHFHLRKHNFAPDEYRDKFGLNKTTSLTSSELAERKAQISAKSYVWGKMTPEEFAEFFKKKLKQYRKRDKQLKRSKGYGRRLNVETMNRYRTCPLQVEERLTKIVDKLGKAPLVKELDAIDSSLFLILSKRFKSYTNALHYFGLRPNKGSSNRNYKKSYLDQLLR